MQASHALGDLIDPVRLTGIHFAVPAEQQLTWPNHMPISLPLASQPMEKEGVGSAAGNFENPLEGASIVLVDWRKRFVLVASVLKVVCRGNMGSCRSP